MANAKKNFLTSLTAAEMKRLLVARERIDVLMAEKEKLTQALNKIEAELAKLMTGAGKTSSTSGKAAKKKARRKTKKAKVAKKSVAKKTAKKKVAKKKVIKKTVVKKKVVKKKVVKKATTKSKGTGRVKLEDVIVKVIKANRGPMNYKDLINAIVKGKLFSSKSSNFDNVLRRTLSTSKLIERAGRGIYKVA